MLNGRQNKFRSSFLSPFKQKIYYLKSLPMGFVSGIRLTQLDEEISVATVPNRWLNKNPFNSMYFAVQSMAAELSTAAPVMMAVKGVDASIALIIVDIKSEFLKKAQSKISFSCKEYAVINSAVTCLKQAGDSGAVTVRTEGKDVDGDVVAVFYFTWSFKRRT